MREYFINADFDLSLRRGRDHSIVDARARQARELSMHQLFLGINGDSILVDEEPEEDFLAYLERLSLPVPSFCVRPDCSAEATFTPFGWNGEAVRLNRGYDLPAEHPPLDVVRQVNSRKWSAALEKDLFGDDVIVGEARGVEELEALLDRDSIHESEWIVKSEHGNSGFGNRRIGNSRLEAADRKAVERLLAEDGCLVVERWRRRITDLVTTFTVDSDGGVDEFLIYEAVNTAAGAFVGDVFDRPSPVVERWRSRLVDAADKVAREIAGEGYFGPVCLDAFVWDDGRGERLRALVEVNARLQVAAAALRLWRLWDCRPVVYWRLFSSKKLLLPKRYDELMAALGDDAFDPLNRRGVLVTSPFKIAERRPRRIGVLMAGADRESVDGFDRRFRREFEK